MADRLVPAEGVPLAPFTSIGVGGPARWFVRATAADEVATAVEWARERGVPLFVLGGGSNIVVADSGFQGLVIQMALSGFTASSEGRDTVITASAGEEWDAFVRATVERGLAGLECLSGIPGFVGGTPIQNVGAYGQEVADTIERLTVYDRGAAAGRILSAADCGFAYRSSRFKEAAAGRFIVCDVTFRLSPDRPRPEYPDLLEELDRAGVDEPAVADVRAAVLAVRRRKGMVIDAADPDTRSVGSFFMNPVVDQATREQIAGTAGSRPPAFAQDDGQVKLPAAWLIERSGFARGHDDGSVGISTKHTLAIVNRGGATARDVLRLAARIKRQVAGRFGVALRPEPVFVGFDGDPDVEYLQHVGAP